MGSAGARVEAILPVSGST